MPILVSGRDDRPLDQGDVLDHIVTSVTVVGGAPEVGTNRVLVVSRPCKALRALHVIVAKVVPRPIDVSGLDEFRELVEVFETLRAGHHAPDSFYLGELESGQTDRHFARFDTLHTVCVPVEEVARAEFVEKHRRFRLAPEFTRDLHQRLFRTFASLGFDDDAWWTDGDLRFLVERGNAIRKAGEAQVESLRSELTAAEMAGRGNKDKAKMKSQLDHAEQKLNRTNELLEPLLREHRRRFEAERS